MGVRASLIAVCIGALAASASAQGTGNPFQTGTTLSGFGGGTVDADGVAPAAGLELGWETTPHLTIEGSAMWSLPGDGQHDFGVTIGPRFNLTRGRPVVPFIAAGVGMYRASFDSLAGPLPPFYGDRLSPDERTDRHGTFDDFLASIGGGAELFLQSHWSVRPDVRLLIVTDSGHARWVTSFTAHVAYHFERHRITD